MAQQPNTQSHSMRKKWNEIAKVLVGRRIVEARYLTRAECDQQGWGRAALLLVLDDGTLAFPLADDEGNYPGALMVIDRIGVASEMPALPV